MENWCFNTVRFMGEPEVLDQLKEIFYEMAQEGQRTGKGQLPDHVSLKKGLVYNLGWSGKSYFYATEDLPNAAVLIEIADRYGLDFRHEYEELTKGIYGLAVYRQGNLHVTELDTEDLELYGFNENTNTYEFDGEHYPNCDEILTILLERKIAILTLTT